MVERNVQTLSKMFAVMRRQPKLISTKILSKRSWNYENSVVTKIKHPKSIIFLKNLEESWLNLQNIIGCLDKFLPKILGRYQRFFKKNSKNSKKNKDSKEFLKVV